MIFAKLGEHVESGRRRLMIMQKAKLREGIIYRFIAFFLSRGKLIISWGMNQ